MSPAPSRRELLRLGVAGAGLAALRPFGRLPVAAAGTPVKRLVVVHLDGGLDTLSVLIPQTLPAYFARRPTLSIAAGESLSLAGGPSTTAYRLHPSLPRLAALWDAGDVAFVHRVGYPDANLSHFESHDIYGYAVRGGALEFAGLGVPVSGWVARLADHYAPTPLGALSLGMGKPPHLFGGAAPMLQVGDLASFVLRADANDPAGHGRRAAYARQVLETATTAGAAGEVRTSLVLAHDLSGQLQAALDAHATFLGGQALAYPPTLLGGRLSDAAAVVHAGFETRVLLTALPGFDTHGNQGRLAGVLPALLAELDGAVGAFADDLTAMGRWDDTVVVLYTEFGRRNYENASGGTDHGGGYTAIVLGGAVNGGLYGPDPVGAGLDAGPVFPASQPTSTTLGLV